MFWIVVWIVGSADGRSLGWVTGAGLVAGIAWQLVARRDLVDRLTFPALCVVVVVGMLGALGTLPYVSSDETQLNYWAAVVAGLVATEAVWRNVDAWRATRALRAARESVPARP